MNKEMLKRGTTVGTSLIREYLGTIMWFFGAVLAVFIVSRIMLTSIGPESYDGPSAFVWGPRYFLGALGVMILSRVDVYIAHGYTRRETLIGTVILGATYSFAGAFILLLWGIARRAVFETDTWSGFASSLASESMVTILLAGFGAIAFQLAYFFTGMLLGACFRRVSATLFLALLVPIAMPVLLAEIIGVTADEPSTLTQTLFPESFGGPTLAVAFVVLLVIPAVSAMFTVRSMPLRTC